MYQSSHKKVGVTFIKIALALFFSCILVLFLAASNILLYNNSYMVEDTFKFIDLVFVNYEKLVLTLTFILLLLGGAFSITD